MGCISDLNLNWGYIALRTAIETEQMANGLHATVRSLEPQLPLRGDSTSGTRHLRRHRVLGCSAHARDGNPYCAKLTAVRNSAAGFYVRSQTCGRRLCAWIVGRRGSLPPAALIPVCRQSVRPARSSAGRDLRTNVGLMGFLDCPLRCNCVRADWASRGSVTMAVTAVDYRLTTNH